ncbi:MAG: hypothetical protein PHV86_08670, partial [Synergistales bacterium]|nr:hypothetical protein [Synergistales bacterium]
QQDQKQQDQKQQDQKQQDQKQQGAAGAAPCPDLFVDPQLKKRKTERKTAIIRNISQNPAKNTNLS